MMALLALPLARKVTGELAALDRALSKVTADMLSARESHEDAELLTALSRIARADAGMCRDQVRHFRDLADRQEILQRIEARRDHQSRRDAGQVGELRLGPLAIRVAIDPEVVADSVRQMGARPRHLVVVLDKGVYGYKPPLPAVNVIEPEASKV